MIAFPIAASLVGAYVLLRQHEGGRGLAVSAAVLCAAWLLTGTRSVVNDHVLWTLGTVVTFAWAVWLLVLAVRLQTPRAGP